MRFPKYNGLFFYLNLLQSCLNVNVVKPTFSFESKVAALADVGSHISVRSYVFLEHAWLLTTNTTLFTYILSPTTASHIHIFLIGLIPDREKQLELFHFDALLQSYMKISMIKLQIHTLLQKSSHGLVLLAVWWMPHLLVKICTSG